MSHGSGGESEYRVNKVFWILYRALATADVGLQGMMDGVGQVAENVLRSLKTAESIRDYRTYGEPGSRYLRMEVSILVWESIHYTFDVRTLTREFMPVAEVLWS